MSRKNADPIVVARESLSGFRELRTMFPEAGKYCAIDAIKIEGPLQQGRCQSGTMMDWVLSRGEEIGQIYHDKKDVTRGWYLVVISDISTGLPMIWHAYPGATFKADDAKSLVQMLFDLWPACPMDSLVGDSEFSTGRQLSLDLEQRFGVHPVFPIRKGYVGSSPNTNDKGQPCCSEHGPMKRKQACGFLTNVKRQEQGIEPGVFHENSLKAHIIWVCRNEKCKVRTTTYVHDDPILHTFWPRAGKDSKFYWERKALMRYRSSIESLFAAVRSRCNAAKGASKCRWNSSYEENVWLMSMTFLGMTLGKLVHKNGAYAEHLEEMEQLKLI